jgi:GntR family transcriptional repressor for pyruvate dehydrogenase complex
MKTSTVRPSTDFPAHTPARTGAAVAGHWGSPIVSRHVADDVVDRLVTAVGLGLYVTGQQLPTERELATMLGVSRNSIREALKQLTDSGYLEVRRGRTGGYFVLADWRPESAEHVRRQLVANWAEFEHIFDARKLVEPLIARTAAERRTKRDGKAMNAALKDYTAAPDHDASRRADTALHLAIAEATHNPLLVSLSIDLRARITLNLGAEPYTDEARRIAVGQHRDLVAAIMAGRPDEAADIAARHFTLSEDLFHRLADRARNGNARRGVRQDRVTRRTMGRS